jgi:hypothetical protein
MSLATLLALWTLSVLVWVFVIFAVTRKLEAIRRSILSELKAQREEYSSSCCSGDSGQLEELRDRNNPLIEETPSKD